ncbi:MAG: PorP/SprF family type IX secretion system membrane protein [Bacteroidia bacterium]
MKKSLFISFVFLFSFGMQAQQAVQYSQFMLNNYGLNPAVAGSEKGLTILVGKRTQWRGFALAPETTFASITKDFGKKGYKYYWHGLGAYIEQDKFGLFTTKTVSGSYTIHLKLSPKYFLGFGVAAGVKSVALSSLFDPQDPAIDRNGPKVLVPDVVPGLYLYSKKGSVGVSARNVYKNTLKQGNKEIGSNGSHLLPTLVFTANKKFRSQGYDFIFVPGINVQSNFYSIPSAQLNFMAYFRQRIGFGVTYRAHDAVAAILQIRVLKNVVVGLSYDYTVSAFRAANANSDEIMIGLSPVMSAEGYHPPGGAADCPKFDFDF